MHVYACIRTYVHTNTPPPQATVGTIRSKTGRRIRRNRQATGTTNRAWKALGSAYRDVDVGCTQPAETFAWSTPGRWVLKRGHFSDFIMISRVLWGSVMFNDVVWCFLMFYDVPLCPMVFFWCSMMFYYALWCFFDVFFLMFYDVFWCSMMFHYALCFFLMFYDVLLCPMVFFWCFF